MCVYMYVGSWVQGGEDPLDALFLQGIYSQKAL